MVNLIGCRACISIIYGGDHFSYFVPTTLAIIQVNVIYIRRYLMTRYRDSKQDIKTSILAVCTQCDQSISHLLSWIRQSYISLLFWLLDEYYLLNIWHFLCPHFGKTLLCWSKLRPCIISCFPAKTNTTTNSNTNANTRPSCLNKT